MLQTHSHELLYQTKCINRLYKLLVDNSNGNTSQISRIAVTNRSVTADPKRWHDENVHISSKRYEQLSKLISTVPSFHPNIMKSIECIPRITPKSRQAPVRTAATLVEFPVGQINIDISGTYIPKITGECYAVHILDFRKAKSDVQLLMTKAVFARALPTYVAYAQNNFAAQGYTFKTDRWKNAGENISKAIVQLCNNNSIKIERSPPYGPEGNGAAERIVQEHLTKARVLMFSSSLPQKILRRGASSCKLFSRPSSII